MIHSQPSAATSLVPQGSGCIPNAYQDNTKCSKHIQTIICTRESTTMRRNTTGGSVRQVGKHMVFLIICAWDAHAYRENNILSTKMDVHNILKYLYIYIYIYIYLIQTRVHILLLLVGGADYLTPETPNNHICEGHQHHPTDWSTKPLAVQPNVRPTVCPTGNVMVHQPLLPHSLDKCSHQFSSSELRAHAQIAEPVIRTQHWSRNEYNNTVRTCAPNRQASTTSYDMWTCWNNEHWYYNIYIYPSAPFRGIRLRSVCCNLPVPSPSNHLNHKLTVKFSFIPNQFQSSSLQLAVCQSGISFLLFALSC